MTKTLLKSLFAAAFMLASSSSANAQTKLLREITSEYGAEYYYYGYNDENKVDSIYLSYPMNDMAFYRLYSYDDKGNQIQEDNYTDMYSDYYPEFNGAWIVTGKNVYGYDEQNRMISKLTYDLDFDSYEYALIISAAYGYTYDEQGRITKSTLYYDEEMTNETEIVNYKYDELGRLSSKELTIAYYEEPEVEKKDVYTYDEQGRLSKITILYNDGVGGFYEFESISYTYDENGNLIGRSDKVADFEDPTLEYRLTYHDDIMAKDVVFPFNYEDETDFYTMSVNAVDKTHIYAILDYDLGKAELYDTQTWMYEDITTTGVNKAVSGTKVKNIIIADGKLMIKGIEGRADVRIYDMNGRPVFSGITNGSVNISTLPAGTYIATSNGVTKKFNVR